MGEGGAGARRKGGMTRAFLAALLVAASAASAQSYPTRVFKFVVPFPPGGGTTIGTDAVAKSAPDGYTLLVSGIASQAIVHHLHPNRPFDFLRDFAPVARIADGVIAFVVPASSPANSVAEIVALAKANPGK